MNEKGGVYLKAPRGIRVEVGMGMDFFESESYFF